MFRADPFEKLRGLLKPFGDADARAAVAMLLKREKEDLEVLLVKRAVSPSDPWSGDMAFPGGRRHPEDLDLMETVTREMKEETGIDLLGCCFLGTLDVTASSVAPKLGVLPFVFLCAENLEISLSPELCSYLWAPLKQLELSRGRYRVHKGEVSSYLVEGEVVWGLTYRMLENLLRLIGKAASDEAAPPG